MRFDSQRRGGSVSRSAPVQSRAAPSRPVARPAPHTPAPVQKSVPAPLQQPSGGGGMFSGIGSTIVSGMAFGTGSAIAHQAVGAVAGSFSGRGGEQAPAQAAAPEYAQGAMAPQQQLQEACSMDKQMFYECLNQNKGDQSSCNFLYEQLKQCQQGQSSMTFN